MIDRLANVIYWAGGALSALAFCFLAVGLVTDTGLTRNMGFTVFVFFLALVPWLVGRAVRYILSGK